MNIYLENLLKDMGIENRSAAIDKVLTEIINLYYDKKMLEEINEEYFINGLS